MGVSGIVGVVIIISVGDVGVSVEAVINNKHTAEVMAHGVS